MRCHEEAERATVEDRLGQRVDRRPKFARKPLALPPDADDAQPFMQRDILLLTEMIDAAEQAQQFGTGVTVSPTRSRPAAPGRGDAPAHEEAARRHRPEAGHGPCANAGRRRLVREPAVVRPAQVPASHHTATLFTIFEPHVTDASLRATGHLVTGLIERELVREGLPKATFVGSGQVQVTIARTADRSVLGCMND